MGDDNTNEKKRKGNTKWTTSYSSMSLLEAEDRLGFRMQTIKTTSAKDMLIEANYMLEGEDSILKTKEKVYDQIVQYLAIEGYPTEANPYFKESSISDLVYSIIGPIIFHIILKTGRDSIQLLREKEIVSRDGVTGGNEEFVVMDLISVKERNYVFVVEAKRSSLGQAMKQCLLAMKDMRGNNGAGKVYGFVTTGKSWRMIKYDEKGFCQSREIISLFEGMNQEKELWMKDYSVVVDLIYAALSVGGIVKKDVTVVVARICIRKCG